jgi:hypothetical protein
MDNVPEIIDIAITGGITAPVVWGCVEVAKSFAKGRKEAADDWTKPWWWNGSLRLGSLILGGGIGTALYGALNDVAGWPWGTMIGIGSGALCTTIVMVVRTKIKAA